MEAMIETPVHWLYCTTEGWHANTPHLLCYQLGLQFLHLLLQLLPCAIHALADQGSRLGQGCTAGRGREVRAVIEKS